ncbi:MAG: heme-binding protein [Blastomonas sp.]
MTGISLISANANISAAIAKGREMQLNPLTVAVLDAGGHVIALQREDGASNLRPQIATAKAAGALALGISSRKIGETAADRPSFIASLHALAPGGIIPAAGGVIVLDENGRAIGAVGVTGDLSDKDEICAFAGIEAAGLRMDEQQN